MSKRKGKGQMIALQSCSNKEAALKVAGYSTLLAAAITIAVAAAGATSKECRKLSGYEISKNFAKFLRRVGEI
jgi:hypothetical protein